MNGQGKRPPWADKSNSAWNPEEQDVAPSAAGPGAALWQRKGLRETRDRAVEERWLRVSAGAAQDPGVR